MRSLAPTAMLLLVAFAGCTSNAPATDCDPDAGDCVSTGDPSGSGSGLPTPSTSNGPVTPPPPPEARLLRFENCTGLFANIEAPYDQVRPFVPPDFYLRGNTADTAWIGFEGLRCDRNSNATQIVENASYFLTFVWVEPRNQSWAPEANSRYVLDTYLSEGAFVEELAAWGADAKESSFFLDQAPYEGGPVLEWSVSSGSEEFVFDYHAAGPPLDPLNVLVYLWYGWDSYLRVDLQGSLRDLDQIDGGTIQMSGSSLLEQAVGAPIGAWTGRPVHEFTQLWGPVEEPFEGETN